MWGYIPQIVGLGSGESEDCVKALDFIVAIIFFMSIFFGCMVDTLSFGQRLLLIKSACATGGESFLVCSNVNGSDTYQRSMHNNAIY